MYFVFLWFYKNEINITNKKKEYVALKSPAITKPDGLWSFTLLRRILKFLQKLLN